MKYGINIFNNLKGCHNLLIFNTKEEAEESYNLLSNLWIINRSIFKKVLLLIYASVAMYFKPDRRRLE